MVFGAFRFLNPRRLAFLCFRSLKDMIDINELQSLRFHHKNIDDLEKELVNLKNKIENEFENTGNQNLLWIMERKFESLNKKVGLIFEFNKTLKKYIELFFFSFKENHGNEENQRPLSLPRRERPV
jgi:hypothetical protein